ncbi:MAG: hypothetical protein MJ138_02685 [Kiritimatiellae bacterium]|nr:hypothetical protein [Kiritimatiellia bacterium]
MYELVMKKMREGDWGAVTRLLHELHGTGAGRSRERTAGTPRRGFSERFEAVSLTPRLVADAVVEENGKFKGIELGGTEYKPSARFLKGLAQRMKVSFSIFELFTPVEVIGRAAERAADLPLRVTLDHEKNEALALVEDKGVPMPAGNVEIVMREDPRLQKFDYDDGVITGSFALGESWDVQGDSRYSVHINVQVPVDGMGTPCVTLSTLRQVCSNGAVAEAPLFRTKMEIKDNSGEHFRRLLRSFNNPRGIEALHERLLAANGTKASVDEVFRVMSFVKRQVRDARHQMLLCERLEAVADNPCVRYGVTDLASIGERRRGLLPVGCSVADLMNFASELGTHHADLIKNPRAVDALTGEFFAKGYDLEEMYPNAQPARGFYLSGIDFGEGARR